MITPAQCALLGVFIRITAYKFIGSDLSDSYIYSSLDEWNGVLEGIHLKSIGVPVYSNDVVHQPPIMLALWSFVVQYLSKFMILFFVAIELVMMYSIYICGKSLSQAIMGLDSKNRHIDSKSKNFKYTHDQIYLYQMLCLVCYCFNPYSILTFSAMSPAIVANLLLTWILITYSQNRWCLSACLCALGCYCRMYPGLLLIPIVVSGLLVSYRRALGSIALFSITLGSLMCVSYLMNDRKWDFINSIYMHQIMVADCTPNLGLHWYLFVEMFDHFRDFFIWVLQLLLVTSVLLLSIRFRSDPVFAMFAVSLMTSALQPYHSTSELACLFSLLPAYYAFRPFTRMALPGVALVFAAFILAPVHHYTWLYTGSGNANFYFATALLHCVGLAFLISDFLIAHGKRQFVLSYGPLLQLVNGQKYSLRLG